MSHIFATRERDVSVTGSATFEVRLEIRAEGCWSRDTTHAQIDTQVLDSAQAKLAKLEAFARNLGIDVKLIGTPVLVEVKANYLPRTK